MPHGGICLENCSLFRPIVTMRLSMAWIGMFNF